jgi:maltooligosyltrehalose trehalohydrolase
VPLERMIFCLQDHSRIGNRRFDRRVHRQVDPALFRALPALLSFAPATPLLFAGQEWGASSPFLFLAGHHQELGRLVTEGRRREFSRVQAFADEETRARIPDPLAASICEASGLNWDERLLVPHAGMLEPQRALLRLRRTENTLEAGTRFDVVEADDDGVALARADRGGGALLLVAWLADPARTSTTAKAQRSPVTDGSWCCPRRHRVFISGQTQVVPTSPVHGPLVGTGRGPAAVIARRE